MLAIINKNVYTLHFLLHYILSLSTLYHDSGILGEGGYPPKFFVEECVPNPETCTLFQTEICDLPYSISDLSKKIATPFQTS